MGEIRRLAAAIWLAAVPLQAVIVDRIAIVVDSQVIKDSDIDRDIRVTDFLNGEPLDLGEAARKQAAQRLIDQAILRREIKVGGYQQATPDEVEHFLTTVLQQRPKADLAKYGITGQQLRKQIAWQMTVLDFIEQRFRPAVLVTEQDVDQFLAEHAAQYRGQDPAKAAEAARQRIAEERVNQEFNAWLNQRHKRANIEYHEASLQ